MTRHPTAALALIPALLCARHALAQPPPPPPPAASPPSESPAASPSESPAESSPAQSSPAAAAQADRPEPDADRAPSEGEQKGEVIVIDSRSEKPLGAAVGAVDVVDRAAIRARGARTVADALRGRIGLEVVPALRGTAVRAQGLDPTYTLILIDGLPAIGRIDGALDVDRLPVDGVERIEIMKGPSSALYGSDALGGVINIVSRDASAATTCARTCAASTRRPAAPSSTAAPCPRTAPALHRSATSASRPGCPPRCATPSFTTSSCSTSMAAASSTSTSPPTSG